MRVTNELMVSSALHRLSTRMEHYERSQTRLATGQQRLAPSDDPGGASRALMLRSQMRAGEQSLRNADDARAWLDATDGALQSVVKRLQRARTLAVAGGNSTGDRSALAAEVGQIREELIDVANSGYRGRPLFGGFSSEDPVDTDGTLNPAATGAIARRISDTETVDINVTAEQAFGLADPDPAVANMFDALDQLVTTLEGDGSEVDAGLVRIDAAIGNITGALSKVGATTNQVESAIARVDKTQISLRTELSEVEDVDIADAIMELQLQEVAYQATLGALGRALPPSLAQFLR